MVLLVIGNEGKVNQGNISNRYVHCFYWLNLELYRVQNYLVKIDLIITHDIKIPMVK